MGDRALIASAGLLFPMSPVLELHLDGPIGRFSRKIPKQHPGNVGAKSSKDPNSRGNEPS
jgi:hypothetical protein